ncbi:MAG: hypothetical protein HY587_07490 [Candidatus Omnitrophica bacterium]|nr:hypothetical protein [Candidatus Omnitrophota bacterium]
MDIPETLSKLEGETSFDLWRLSVAIDHMLKDSKRVDAVRSRLRVGQEITYLDGKENREISATVLEVHRTHALVRNHHDEKRWSIPFHMINIEGVRNDMSVSHNKVDRATLKVGDHVGFLDRQHREVYGTVTKLNSKTASVTLATGERWRVGYGALFRVLECEATVEEESSVIQLPFIPNH